VSGEQRVEGAVDTAAIHHSPLTVHFAAPTAPKPQKRKGAASDDAAPFQ
jgi:hypothetical protein